MNSYASKCQFGPTLTTLGSPLVSFKIANENSTQTSATENKIYILSRSFINKFNVLGQNEIVQWYKIKV